MGKIGVHSFSKCGIKSLRRYISFFPDSKHPMDERVDVVADVLHGSVSHRHIETTRVGTSKLAIQKRLDRSCMAHPWWIVARRG